MNHLQIFLNFILQLILQIFFIFFHFLIYFNIFLFNYHLTIYYLLNIIQLLSDLLIFLINFAVKTLENIFLFDFIFISMIISS